MSIVQCPICGNEVDSEIVDAWYESIEEMLDDARTEDYEMMSRIMFLQGEENNEW